MRKVKSLCHVQLFATPRTEACPAPLFMEFSRKEYWSRYPFPSPRGSSQFRDQTGSPASQADSLPPEPPGRSCSYISSVQALSRVQLFATPWTAAHQASLSITNSQGSLKLMSIKSVTPPNHLILCCPLLFLPSIFPSIRVFSNESVVHIRWPSYWSFSISPSNEYSGLISCSYIVNRNTA